MINDGRAGREHVGPKAKPQSEAEAEAEAETQTEAETESRARLALAAFRGRDGDSLGVGQCGNWQLGHGKGHSLLGLGTENGQRPYHRQWHQGKLDNNTQQQKKHNAQNVNITWKLLAKH